MFLSSLSIKRSVLMTMVIMSFVVIGAYSYLRLAVELTPEVDFPVVTATVVYPGAGPKEVETLIVEPIEEQVSTISGIKHVQAVARESVGLVLIEFEIGTDVDIAAIDVKDKIDAIRASLPQDAEAPVISKFDLNALPVIDLAISSRRPLDELYRIADDVIKERLSIIPGVASIDIIGGTEREILIAVYRDRLRAYGLSITDIVGSIAMGNLEIPGGHIQQGRKEYTLRLAGEFRSLQELSSLRIPLSPAASVRLTDVAEVVDGFKEQRDLARLNGKSAVGMAIVKKGEANTVQVAQDVRKALTALQQTLPTDISVEIARDRSVFIERSVADVMSNLLIGIVLTAFVLYLFLHSWRGTLIAAVAMPTSIVATFTLILFAGFTLNFMSLMALAISVGILVANSVVVLENILRRLHLGESATVAADRGTGEIALAVVASTLTNIVVFTPIAFMGGIVGQFFKQFGLTVTFATLFSLLVSFTLTPMLAAKLLNKEQVIDQEGKPGLLQRFGKWFDSRYQALETSYRGGLDWALRHRGLVSAAITVIFFGSLMLLPFVGSEFITPSDEGQINISIEMPAGTRLEQTDATLLAIEKALPQFPEVASWYTVVGRIDAGGIGVSPEGVDVGQVVVNLVPKEAREKTTREVIDDMLPVLATIPAADIAIKPNNPFGGGEADLQIEVAGEDEETLGKIAHQVMRIVRETPGTNSVKTTYRLGKPELRIKPDRERIANYGLSIAQVATALRTSVQGDVATAFRDGDDEYDIRVRFVDTDRGRVDQIGSIGVRSGRGHILPLSELGRIELAEGPSQISRKDKRRMVLVTANLAGRTLGEVQRDLQMKFAELLDLPEGYGIYFAGQSERQAESFANILQALVLAIVLTYMALAAILESYLHPFTIMMTLPLALVGVILSLVITGATLSIFSMMALVMLVGIVVNNGILLLDYIHVLREQGKKTVEAILEACSTRLRPIIMMNLAVALGMLPLALGLGEGSETRAPMSIVSIGGIITSTVFTLFLIPVIYLTFENIKARLRRQPAE